MKEKNGYPFRLIESRWQKKWEEAGLHSLDLSDASDKYYCLVMFLYPSAQKLHIGHFFNYGPADTWARYMKMKGCRVFEPMGYDAFGLPAENYAIREGVHPAASTAENIRFIREQLKRIGAMYDWSREINTSSPDYYRWTQWLFLRLFKKGLAYRKKAPVNWCPGCVTVLANEQVVEGCCERCGSSIAEKNMEQWFFRITDYADRLLEGLKTLDWPDKTKQMQANWIGRSEGARIDFSMRGRNRVIPVFTTRADTVFGATYMVIAPEHPVARDLAAEEPGGEIARYLELARKSTCAERASPDREKTGVFTGINALNPANGKEIPVWISDYVLLTYGTGAVMAVPAHDERDYEFALKYSLPIRVVVLPEGGTPGDVPERAYTGEGRIVNSGEFDGMSSAEARGLIVKRLKQKGAADFEVNYKLRDWLVSRQRYWGAPIPIIRCARCGDVPVPEQELPVLLPEKVDFLPGAKARSPLETSEDFANAPCPACGGSARREADTMDTFVCSSWYYLRYPDPEMQSAAFNHELVEKWLPVDMYIGGAEHAVMHLLYARFITKFLHDEGLVHFEEPFTRLVHQGTITNRGAKMSKSRGNVVNPDKFIDDYGSDTFRMYLMFTGPFEEGGDWNDRGINGIHRFLCRVWDARREEAAEETADRAEFERMKHFTVLKVSRDIERFHFNTAISAMMEYLNYLTANARDISRQDRDEALRTLTLLISPFAPHLGEELWSLSGGKGSVFEQSWPVYDEEKASAKEVTLVIQVDGKVRHKITVAAGSGEETLKKLVFADERVIKITEGKKISRVVVVPDRVVNIVTGR